MTGDMIEASDVEEAKAVEDLREASDLLCLWRVCANLRCRRARTCRGRAYACAGRNYPIVPESVREFFEAFLAAKYAGLDFEDFRYEMDGREETEAFFAWRRAARAPRR
jgi:hypothetical protein